MTYESDQYDRNEQDDEYPEQYPPVALQFLVLGHGSVFLQNLLSRSSAWILSMIVRTSVSIP